MNNDGLTSLVKAIQNNSGLVRVKINNNNLSGEEFKNFSKFLATNTTMRELEIDYVTITIDFLKALKDNKGLRKLKMTLTT